MAAVQPVSLSFHPEFQLKHILVATDFSDCSHHAMQQAAAIARLHGSDLLVLHVIPPQPMIENALEPAAWELDDIRQQAQSQMSSAEVVDLLAGVRHRMLVEHGILEDIFSKLIKEHEISLVVLGTHGRSGFKKLLLGSVAEEIFRTTECAVMTVTPWEPATLLTQGRFQSVLFATDFSHGSMHALPYAIGFAQESRARLTLLHIVEESSVSALYMHERLIAESRQRMEKIVAAQAELAIAPEIEVESGFPIDQILHLASKKKADLIVMGVHQSHGWGARASAHLPWTIAQTVVCRAKCPVLTVRG
jgi:nucleotide-binding universal stress UspA family protein